MYKNHTHTQHNTIQVAKVKQEREREKRKQILQKRKKYNKQMRHKDLF